MNDNEKKYAVVIVFSSWLLRDICSFLENELGATDEQIGLIRIDRVKDGDQYKETNRTILLLDRCLLEAAKKMGYTQYNRNFKMAEYEVREHSLPRKGSSRNFYIPLPKELSGSDARAQIQNKLDVLVRFGMFPLSRPRLNIPLESRETGTHKNMAFVSFSKDTPVETIALARILIHDTRLYSSEEEFGLMKCFWARENKNKGNKGSRDDRKTSKGNKNSKGKAGNKNKNKSKGKKKIIVKKVRFEVIGEPKEVEVIDEPKAVEVIEPKAVETIDEPKAVEVIDEPKAVEVIDETKAVEIIDEPENLEEVEEVEETEKKIEHFPLEDLDNSDTDQKFDPSSFAGFPTISHLN